MILEKISLKKHNTFGLNIKADRLISFRLEENAIHFFKEHRDEIGRDFFVLGGGSNVLFINDYHGTIIHPEMEGISLEEKKNDYIIISAGAGVVWDKLVELTIHYGFGGLENLSLIPGLVGAVPVQNIGAYGSEAKDFILKVRAVDISDGSVREFSGNECRFGYRNSIFKEELRNKYLITKVFFKLHSNQPMNTEYGSLKEEINKLGSATLGNVRKIIMNTRQSKLPDPALLGNAGSFFKNPYVNEEVSEKLRTQYPKMPLFREASGAIKLAAGWLIEQCGWKGKRIGDTGVYEKQALIIVNYGNASGMEIFQLSEKIRKSVFEKFGIDLQREVEVIGLT